MIAMEHNTLGTIVVFRNIAPLFTLFIERMFRVPMVVSAETIGAVRRLRVRSRRGATARRCAEPVRLRACVCGLAAAAG